MALATGDHTWVVTAGPVRLNCPICLILPKLQIFEMHFDLYLYLEKNDFIFEHFNSVFTTF